MARKKEHTGTVNLVFGKDFPAVVRHAMDKEMITAENKRGIRLSRDERELVLKHAYQQLEFKLRELGCNFFDFTDSAQIAIRNLPVDFVEISDRDMNLSGKLGCGGFIVSGRNFWQFSEEPNPKFVSVPVNDFYREFIETFKRWAGTAVFYGVSSYA